MPKAEGKVGRPSFKDEETLCPDALRKAIQSLTPAEVKNVLLWIDEHEDKALSAIYAVALATWTWISPWSSPKGDE
jgi:hypothetical protein